MRTPELAHISSFTPMPSSTSSSPGCHRLQAQCYASNVPGDANPADIPSRVPFIWSDGEHIIDHARLRAGKTGAADTDTVNLLQARHRPAVFPRAEQLQEGMHSKEGAARRSSFATAFSHPLLPRTCRQLSPRRPRRAP